MRTVLSIAALALVPALAWGTSPPKRLADRGNQAVERGARFLGEAQADLPALGGGAIIRATWPWHVQTPVAAPNAAGIVAHSLVTAHRRTGDPESLKAALAWGRARVSDAKAGAPMFDPDVEALAALATATTDPSFARAAREAFDQRHSGANGREIVERLFWVRGKAPSLVGYDAALALRAALAVGEHAKAAEVADALAATAPRWNVPDEHGFFLTSRAAVLAAVSPLGGASRALAHGLRAQVLSSQAEDGTWGGRHTQATAYSVRALWSSGDAEAREAAARGARFLTATQLASGGWASFHDFLPEPFVGETFPEVSAEVLVAIAAID